MQPQQPNFDFIMNAGPPPQKSGIGGNSMVTRILVVVGGLFVLAIIAAIVISVLGSAGKAFDKGAMLSVAQDQTELIRVSTIGTQDGVSQSVKNFSITTQLGLKSEQQALLTYLATGGYEPSPDKDLILKQSVATDQQLTSAKSSSTFDTAYKSVMQKALQTYQSDLKAAYGGASSDAQTVLSKRYDTSQLLLAQLNAAN